MQPPVELDSIEDDALAAKGELVLCLNSIENNTGGKTKARLVAMGNVLYDRHMSIRRDAAMHDMWSPVALTAEARIVAARAAARVMFVCQNSKFAGDRGPALLSSWELLQQM